MEKIGKVENIKRNKGVGKISLYIEEMCLRHFDHLWAHWQEYWIPSGLVWRELTLYLLNVSLSVDTTLEARSWTFCLSSLNSTDVVSKTHTLSNFSHSFYPFQKMLIQETIWVYFNDGKHFCILSFNITCMYIMHMLQCHWICKCVYFVFCFFLLFCLYCLYITDILMLMTTKYLPYRAFQWILYEHI